MSKTTVVLVATLYAALACSDSPTAPAGQDQLSFAYSGGMSGSMNLSGAPTDETAKGVMAFSDSGITLVMAISSLEKAGPTIAIVGFPSSASGTLPITDQCDMKAAQCAGMLFALAITVGAEVQQLICNLTSGSVTLTTATATRISGTFSGAGTCINTSTDAESSTTVTGGTFSTKLSANPFADLP